MGRIFVYLIFMVVSIILSIISPRRRGSFYRHSMYGRNYYGDDNTMNYIRMFIRRRRALSKAKAFIKKKRHNITLKNSNVMFIFDTKFKTFVLLDVKNSKRSATVIWAEQHINDYDVLYNEVDTEMEKTFDSICRSFNEISTYLGVLQVLKNKFKIVKENNTQQEQKNTPAKAQKSQPDKPQQEKVNINSMNETALANLPGISIIQAKKIIDRINFKGDFNNIEEFYKEMKIKPHFQKKLNNLVYAKPIEKQHKTNDNDRIIDL